MLRFYFVIGISVPLIIYYVLAANYYCSHTERYDMTRRYQLARRIVRDVKRRANIATVSHGLQNLPKEGGFIMYSNHQGRYDALGIIDALDEPCSVIMDAERSRLLLANQVMELVDGIRLERHDFRQQVTVLKRMTEQAKNGVRYIYFPEGGYNHNGNRLQDFRPGAFKVAKNAKCPIVPVAIYDSHIPFDFNSLKKVTTQVCFMEPLYYEDYVNMTTQEISDLVKSRIENKLDELEEYRRENGYNMWFKEYKNC